MFDIPTPRELKNARKDCGLTQGDLADKIDMSQAMLSRIERGDVDPTISTVRKICLALEDEAE
jgi:predicted transcriptional regulator